MTKLRYTKAQLKYFKEQGKKGGEIQKKKGREYFSKIGKLGGAKKCQVPQCPYPHNKDGSPILTSAQKPESK
jgi:hypothetical protein